MTRFLCLLNWTTDHTDQLMSDSRPLQPQGEPDKLHAKMIETYGVRLLYKRYFYLKKTLPSVKWVRGDYFSWEDGNFFERERP